MVPFRWKVLDDFPIRQFYKKIIPKGILDRFQAVFRQKSKDQKLDQKDGYHHSLCVKSILLTPVYKIQYFSEVHTYAIYNEKCVHTYYGNDIFSTRTALELIEEVFYDKLMMKSS